MIYILKGKGKGKYGLNANQIFPSDLFRLNQEVIRLKDQTLLAADWIQNAVSGLYEYTFVNSKITASSEVEFIPHAESEDTVIAAEVRTHTPVSNGQVIIQAVNAPAGDIVVDVIIDTVQDV